MTQRILCILILGAISIGTTTALSHSSLTSARQGLIRQERIAGAGNRQLLSIRHDLDNLKAWEADIQNEDKLRRVLGKPAPVEVRVVK
jgi:hypothetical protein